MNAEIVEYRVLLSYPKSVTVELVEPGRVRLAKPEPEVRGDKDTHISDPLYRMPSNGYSPSADLTRPVVYVNYGTAEDYDRLERSGVSVKGKLVLARYLRGYRGGKGLEAERRGAAGIIVYSDPADDGETKGPAYPYARLMAQERALLDDDGIPGRPWFRHLIYAPLPSYEAETLPGLREALEAGDRERARQQAQRLRQAPERAIRASQQGTVGAN